MATPITITGTGFTEESVIRVDGVDVDTAFEGEDTLTAEIPTSVMQDVGEHEITVFNPTPGGGETAAEIFTVEYADPTIVSLTPDTVAEDGGAITVTITGTGFAAASQAKFDGSNRTTNFISDTEIEIELLSGDVDDVGTFDITVVNPTPGGGTSNAEPFDVTAASGLWRPTDIPNLAAWYDPSDSGTYTLTSGRVSQLDDQSGNGNHLTEVSANGPTIAAAQWNGMDALSYPIATRQLHRSNAGLTNINGPDLSVFVVCEVNFPFTGSSGGLISQSNSSWSDGWRIGDTTGSRDSFDVTVKHYNSGNVIPGTGTDTGAGHPFLYGFTWENTPHELKSYENGFLVGSNTGNSSTVDFSTDLYLGYLDGGQSLYPAFIGDAVIVDGLISQSDREKLEGYLAHKYGFDDTLDSGHPYKAAPP